VSDRILRIDVSFVEFLNLKFRVEMVGVGEGRMMRNADSLTGIRQVGQSVG